MRKITSPASLCRRRRCLSAGRFWCAPFIASRRSLGAVPSGLAGASARTCSQAAAAPAQILLAERADDAHD